MRAHLHTHFKRAHTHKPHVNASQHSDGNKHFLISSSLHYSQLAACTVSIILLHSHTLTHTHTQTYITQPTRTHTQVHGTVNQGMLNQCQNSINSPAPCDGGGSLYPTPPPPHPPPVRPLFLLFSPFPVISFSSALPHHFLSSSSSSFHLADALKSQKALAIYYTTTTLPSPPHKPGTKMLLVELKTTNLLISQKNMTWKRLQSTCCIFLCLLPLSCFYVLLLFNIWFDVFFLMFLAERIFFMPHYAFEMFFILVQTCKWLKVYIQNIV